jgi:NhaC family Na+:H+ antiporter
VIVIGLIIKTEPLIALLFGTLLAGNFAILTTPHHQLLEWSMTFSLLERSYGRHNGRSSHPTDNETLTLFFTSEECKKYKLH